jgi:hypothetical protein
MTSKQLLTIMNLFLENSDLFRDYAHEPEKRDGHQTNKLQSADIFFIEQNGWDEMI